MTGRDHQIGLMVGLALVAAAVASALGAIGYMAWLIATDPAPGGSGGGVAMALAGGLVISVMVATLAFVVGAPVLAMVAAPLTWPLRRIIAEHPVAAAVVLATIGAVAGRWLEASINDQGAAMRLEREAPYFGAMFALAWVAVVWRCRALYSPTDHPARGLGSAGDANA